MDLVGFSKARFDEIATEYRFFARKLGLPDVRFIPISAIGGDMVVERGEHLGWYDGPTLLEALEGAPAAHSEHEEPFRFPVQWVCRPQTAEHHDFRGYMGQVESGEIAVGDEVQVLPSGLRTRVASIRLHDRALETASAEQSVTLLLADDVDVSRGDMIVRPREAPTTTKALDATVCWLAERPLETSRRYLVRHTTRETRAMVAEIVDRVDLNALERVPAERLAMNDIGRVRFRLAQPLFVDPYAANRATGAFIVVDEATNDTVGAGMVEA
jgi:sulfate adenylyltransferase subunit 1